MKRGLLYELEALKRKYTEKPVFPGEVVVARQDVTLGGWNKMACKVSYSGMWSYEIEKLEALQVNSCDEDSFYFQVYARCIRVGKQCEFYTPQEFSPVKRDIENAIVQSIGLEDCETSIEELIVSFLFTPIMLNAEFAESSRKDRIIAQKLQSVLPLWKKRTLIG